VHELYGTDDIFKMHEKNSVVLLTLDIFVRISDGEFCKYDFVVWCGIDLPILSSGLRKDYSLKN
jgi:hypothetical protein